VDKFHFQQDNIVLLKNEEATKISILQEFSNITKKAESNDRVLIFFAGHGETEDLPDGGEMGYLLPVDGNNTDLYISAIKMDEIQTISLRSEAKHILYLIDACYGGIASIGSRGLDAQSTPDYLQKITQYKSRQIISAGGRGEQVIEKSEWGHSAFTKNLLSGLRDSKADADSDGIITAQELGIYLKKKVTIDSDNRQTPKTRNLSSDEGEFVFVYSENTAVIKDKSTDAKLDAVLAKLEKLESQKNSPKVDIEKNILDNIIHLEDAKIEVLPASIEIKSKDGDNVKIDLNGITIKNKMGENIYISSKAILGGLLVGLCILVIILVIFGSFLSSLLKSIVVIIGKFLSSLLRKIINPIKQLLKSGRK
jgi:hypothetical protein